MVSIDKFNDQVFFLRIDAGPFSPSVVKRCIEVLKRKDSIDIEVESTADPSIVESILLNTRSISSLTIDSDMYNRIITIPNNIHTLILVGKNNEFKACFKAPNITFRECNNMTIADTFVTNNNGNLGIIKCERCSEAFIRRIGTNLVADTFVSRFIDIEPSNATISLLHNQIVTEAHITQIINRRNQLFDVNVGNNIEQFWRLRKLPHLRTLMIDVIGTSVLNNYDGLNHPIEDFYIRNEYFTDDVSYGPRYSAAITRTLEVRPQMKKIYLLLNPRECLLPIDLIRVIRDKLYA